MVYLPSAATVRGFSYDTGGITPAANTLHFTPPGALAFCVSNAARERPHNLLKINRINVLIYNDDIAAKRRPVRGSSYSKRHWFGVSAESHTS
jgi:hypothetical protein